VAAKLAEMTSGERVEKTLQIEKRLFSFANFMESKIPLLYVNGPGEVETRDMIKRCYVYNKMVILPYFGKDKSRHQLMKVDNPDTDLKTAPGGGAEPDPKRCKKVPLECIDIAVIPGIALDEKGGRIGPGDGYYDRLIPKLPITARKVTLAMECQIFPQIPMESHDKHMDIIITEDRIIYKI
jgi:5-formyltetrahydrofolate cyclo-ligase